MGIIWYPVSNIQHLVRPKGANSIGEEVKDGKSSKKVDNDGHNDHRDSFRKISFKEDL